MQDDLCEGDLWSLDLNNSGSTMRLQPILKTVSVSYHKSRCSQFRFQIYPVEQDTCLPAYIGPHCTRQWLDIACDTAFEVQLHSQSLSWYPSKFHPSLFCIVFRENSGIKNLENQVDPGTKENIILSTLLSYDENKP